MNQQDLDKLKRDFWADFLNTPNKVRMWEWIINRFVLKNREINMEKILIKVEKINEHLKKTNHFLSTKGIIHLTINLVEEQLNER